MNFEILLAVERVNSQINAAGQQMELGRISVIRGEVHDVNLGILIQAQVIAPAQLDFDATVFGPHFVAFDDNEVDFALLIAQILAPLDIDIALDIAYAGITAAVVALGIAESEKGENDCHGHCHH
jgi:hypothetical protein